jgi:hypothetical protein
MTYTKLLQKGFMSEVVNYDRITLGDREQYFILLFAQHSFSAYELCSFLKTKTTLMKPMAYKNVHNRIQRLVALGLLEELEGDFKRNAIKYKLTSRGVYEVLSMANIAHAFVWLDYCNNVILQTLLFQYFEVATIRKLGEAGYGVATDLVGRYLKKCSDAILLTLKQFRDMERKFSEHQTFKQHRARVLDANLDTAIRNELNDFVLAIVMATGGEHEHGRGNNLFPMKELRNDKKFISVLQQMKEDFDSGYTRFFD